MSGGDQEAGPSAQPSTEAEGDLPPLVVEFEVAAPRAHAFDLWVRRTELWWPASHTMSGRPDRIVFEPEVGGQIFEQAADGTRHPWGEIVLFDPPRRIRYRWHPFFDPSEATVVDVRFDETPTGTLVHLEQTGWDALGPQGPPRRQRTAGAWAAITERYRRQLDPDPPSSDDHTSSDADPTSSHHRTGTKE